MLYATDEFPRKPASGERDASFEDAYAGMDDRVHVQLLSDDSAIVETISEAVGAAGHALARATHRWESATALRENRVDIVLVDARTPDVDVVEFIRFIKDFDPIIEILVLADSEDPSHPSGVDKLAAIKEGAHAVLPRPPTGHKLRQVLDDLVDTKAIRKRVGSLVRDIDEVYRFHGMVGRNPQMLDIFDLVKRLAEHYSTVLILGESGTGKELVARALHDYGPRSAGPYVACNCAALVDNLLESELFGHVRGAFTGAIRDKRGLFEVAAGGTIFLDEVGELSLPLQTKLLRVLESREFMPVGSTRTVRTDARVVAATNRELAEMVRKGQFREDLYYRLNVVEIGLPALRERKDDVPLLCRHFIERMNERFGRNVKGLTRAAQIMLMNYAWPGNIRELENVLERAFLLSNKDFIDTREIPTYLNEPTRKDPEPAIEDDEEDLSLDAMEARHIRRVLMRCNGNKNETAKTLKISRSTLYKKLSKYQIT